MKLFIRAAGLALAFASSLASAQDWSKGVATPQDGRPNPYSIPDSQLPQVIRAGRLHALNYPVSVTGILLPYQPIRQFLNSQTDNPLRFLLEKFAAGFSHLRSMDDMQAWLGLPSYPASEGTGPYFIPFQNGTHPRDRMGFTMVQTPQGSAFTISCAQCHSANLFGRRVLGLTNRFPRANAAFVRGLSVKPFVSDWMFQSATGASDSETDLFMNSLAAMDFVGAKMPAQLGLDTSLAQVALSLAKREKDAWATRNPDIDRPEPLADQVADSKPAVWWNVKYKDRWLSDGSIVSGNPIFTNFLWNEIGRGTDLHKLDGWLSENAQTVKELTTAVFNAQAPEWTDFFSAESIDLSRAKHGQILFNEHCARCHGTYEKAWDLPQASGFTAAQLLKTVHVNYPKHTFVANVGTDPSRYLGMKSLVQLNDLEISKRNGIVIELQKGYVPPPLVGIWARWPYFHNNSAPSLCAVLTRAEDRPITYWAREANDPKRDFDSVCNGYPERPPNEASPAQFYDTRHEGLANTGHDEGIFLKNGQELLSEADKLDLIVFLQTL